MFIEIRFHQTRYQLKRNYYSQKLKIPNSGKVAPDRKTGSGKQAALTIQRITSVHFKPEFIGCHLNIWLKMAHTRLTKGIPTSKIPAMYITMADSGEVGSTTSAIGKKGNESCTTTNSHRYRSKQQRHEYSKHKQYRTANNGEYHQNRFSTANRLPSPAYLPTSARKYGACPTSYNHSPHWQLSRSHPSPSFRYSLPYQPPTAHA